jgi:hypothetical protein
MGESVIKSALFKICLFKAHQLSLNEVTIRAMVLRHGGADAINRIQAALASGNSFPFWTWTGASCCALLRSSRCCGAFCRSGSQGTKCRGTLGEKVPGHSVSWTVRRRNLKFLAINLRKLPLQNNHFFYDINETMGCASVFIPLWKRLSTTYHYYEQKRLRTYRTGRHGPKSRSQC